MDYVGGQELLSTAGTITLSNVTYLPSFEIESLRDTTTARVSLPWTPERVARVITGAYRGNAAGIYYIPAADDGDTIFSPPDALTLLTGIVRSTGFDGRRIIAEIAEVALANRAAPSFRLEQFTAFAAQSGETITFDGETITLEART